MLVSIITPLYNAEEYIEFTIKSVLNQTYQDWEMIIVNDKATDNSLEIAQKFAEQDSRIKVICNEENMGVAKTRNRGIEEAKGKYIAFLDSDDAYLPTKLEDQVKFMEDNNYYFSVVSDIYINTKNEPTGYFTSVLKEITYKKSLLKNWIRTSTVIYNAEVIGKRKMPILKVSEDYAYWLSILRDGYNCYGLNKKLSLYRVAENSLSSNKIRMFKFNWKVFREYCNLNVIFAAFCICMLVILKLIKIDVKKGTIEKTW